MNKECGKTWSLAFVHASLSKTFVREDFKTHRERLFYEQEVALLPATQEAAQHFVRVETLEKQIKEVRALSLDVTRQGNTLIRNQELLLWSRINKSEKHENRLKQYHKEVRQWKKTDPELATLTVKRTQNAQLLHDLQIFHRMQVNNNAMDAPVTQERRTFLRRCGDGDCKGFLSTQWKCGLCNLKTCNHCHVFLGQNDSVHECNADDVATAKLLQTDSTPCPSCATLIFKIDGCDQMWCTQCHTAFSWTQKRIVNGPVHNPHYFEFLRNQRARGQQQQRNPQDMLCGRDMDPQLCRDFLDDLRFLLSLELQIQYGKWSRFVVHVHQVELHRFRTDRVRDNQTLRIKYLLNRITEKEFKSLLHKEWKATAKKREIYDILFMFVQASTEIFFRARIMRHCKELENAWKEVEALISYVNECFVDVSNLFDSVKLHMETLRDNTTPYRLITQK
jgi:hypothetical protein